jgi:hypothetical protein
MATSHAWWSGSKKSLFAQCAAPPKAIDKTAEATRQTPSAATLELSLAAWRCSSGSGIQLQVGIACGIARSNSGKPLECSFWGTTFGEAAHLDSERALMRLGSSLVGVETKNPPPQIGW